jgi:uncharacterized repeat protein (TIGR01451 family)
MRKPIVATLLLFSLVASVIGATPAFAGDFGDWEIDGDTANAGGNPPGDWDAPPPNTTLLPAFKDAPPPKNGDDIFTGGSKGDAPGGWTCGTGSAPQKDDILSGQIAFRTLNNDQYVFTNFRRLSANGDAHVDYEFNKTSEPHQNSSCAAAGIPRRSDGDIVLTFDTDTVKQGKTVTKKLFVRAFVWDGNENTGTLVEFPVGSQGVTWDAASGDGEKFGESGLNLTETIGEIGCDDFATVRMASRASTSPGSALKDLTKAKPVGIGNCPNSELHKSVRNVTDGQAFSTTDPELPSSTNADPGETVEYRLTYHNHGNTAATGVALNDEVPNQTTFVSCGGDVACTPPGADGEIDWNLGTVAGGGTVVVTFRVRLDAVFPSGSTPIKNIATTVSDTETSENSNETTVNVTAAPRFDQVDKEADEDSVNVGDTTTYRITVYNNGNADGTTTVIDDFDEAHVTVSNISDGGAIFSDAGNQKIRWTNVFVAAMSTKELTYDATFKGPFTGTPGGNGCGGSQFAVFNTVTLDGGATDTEKVCVTAEPVFEVTKTPSRTTANISDADQTNDSVTYTIRVTNKGDADGTTPVKDDFDEAHVTVSNISNGGSIITENGNQKISWGNVFVPATNPDTTLTFTYTATFHGPFNGAPNTNGCTGNTFGVVNAVSVTGDSDSNTICVTALPSFDTEKSSSPASANVSDSDTTNDSVTVTVTTFNRGEADGTTDVVDNFDEVHVTPSNISGGGQIVDGTILWEDVFIAAGNPDPSVTFTYTATFHGPFSGTRGTGPCSSQEYEVINTVTVTGDTDTDQTCVVANPNLTLAKSADLTSADVGDQVTYTITYSNTGQAEAQDLVIHEDIPDGTSFDSCSDTCTENGNPVTSVDWEIGDVPAGTIGETVTLTVTVEADAGCQICNTATATAGNQTIAPSNEVCVATIPAPNPADADASGSAFGAHVRVEPVVDIDETLVPVSSAQHGVGTDSDDDEVLNVAILPPDGNVLEADVLKTSSSSTVDDAPAEANQTSIAQAVGVNVLDGVVTASLVRAVATTHADGGSSSFSSVGSTFKDLRVQGNLLSDVAPNTKIKLPAALFGAQSYVLLREEVGSTSSPDPTQTTGGDYAADLLVNMIHVVATNVAGLGRVEVIVSNAVAHSDFPRTEICELGPTQAVSGHAFIASETTAPEILPVTVGLVEIPNTGGSQSAQLDTALLAPGEGDIVTAHVVETSSSGTLGVASSDASSYASATNVCLLTMAGACTIYADVVRSTSNSSADTTGASSDAVPSYIANLVIGGTPITVDTDPNQVIELPGGLGFVIINEQICDNGADLALNCDDGSGHSGLTVRAIHVILTVPDMLGAEVIVAEAHSDATFQP